jgi:hypothetical protein
VIGNFGFSFFVLHFSFFILQFAFFTPSAPAQSVPEICAVRVGIGGSYKAGLWTPVEVTLRAGAEPWAGGVCVVAPDGDGVPCRFSTPAEPPCRIAAGQTLPVVLFVRIGRTHGELTVELRESEGLVARRGFKAGASDGPSVFRPALPSTSGLILVIGPDSYPAEEVFGGLRQAAGGRSAVVRVSDPAQLPARWYGYEAVDLVVLATSDPAVYASLKPDGPQIEALDQWTRMGGTLLLCAGRQAEKVLTLRGPLGRFSPGRLVRTIPLRHSSAIESYSGSGVPVPRDGVGQLFDLRVPQLADVQGTVEAREGNLPLVVRSAREFGSVVFAAFDLDTAPLRDWQDRGFLVAKLLDVGEIPLDAPHQSGAVLHYGFDDMAGQLRSALDQFAGVPVVPFSLMVAIVIGYLVLIGPVDYFVLRRFSRRMELTWLTFSSIVLAFCVGAYVLVQSLKGDRVRVNQVDLVDVDLSSGAVRGTSWADVFSPAVDRYNLSFEPRRLDGAAAADSRALVGWLGLPGEALGGMDPKTATLTAWKQVYDCSPGLDALIGVPLPVWSSKSLIARWSTTATSRPAAKIADKDRTPVGLVTNTLGFPLKGCLLCYGRWAYRLGDLGPGESAEVGPVCERRDLTTLLTGRKYIFEEGTQRATPYDRGSVDAAYILRAMMFFKAAGGYRYTGLVHRHQGFVDSSDLLKTDHAILVAIGPQDDPQSACHGARLVRDGQPLGGPEDRHTTIYRFVVPVTKDKG